MTSPIASDLLLALGSIDSDLSEAAESREEFREGGEDWQYWSGYLDGLRNLRRELVRLQKRRDLQ